MTWKTRLALITFAFSMAAPARAQRSVEVRPVVPVVGGPTFSGAAMLGLTAPRLSAPTLPSASLTMPRLTPTLPTVAVAASARAQAFAAAQPAAAFAAPAYAAAAAAPEAPKGQKPVLAGLETAAKPFATEEGRASADAGAKLALAFDNNILQAADEAAAVIPGAQSFPRVAGAGLARPFNGVSEEKKAETPRPAKPASEKPETRGQRIAAGVLIAMLLAGSLFAWYTLYASMGQVFQMGEHQLYEQMHVPPGAPHDLGDIFR